MRSLTWPDVQALVPANGKSPDFLACLEAFPDLELAKSTLQGAFHLEGDVWTHTKLVLEALLGLPEYQAADRADQEIVFIAALLHDVAKHRTTAVDPVTGAISQPGHSRKGAIDARIALWDAGAPFEVREAICRLIQVHQVPFFAATSSPRNGRSAEFVVRELSWNLNIRLLALLAEADMRGRICADQAQTLDAIELFREYARDEDCYGKPRHFADAHTAVSYFRGANVHPDYPLHQLPGSKVIVMSGLPASGKDTWAATNHPQLPVVSFDDARAELGLQYGRHEGQVAQRTIEKAKILLRRHEPFLWNATHLSAELRAKTLDILFAYSAEVTLVYLEQPRQELMRRNGRRDSTLPNAGIAKMLHWWEVPLPSEVHAIRYS